MAVNSNKKQQTKAPKQAKAEGTRAGVLEDWRGTSPKSREGKHRVGSNRDGQ